MIKRSEIAGMTSARFVAAALVIAFHFAQAPLAAVHWTLRRPVENGWIGVPFFFVLSGYVLAMQYPRPWSGGLARFWAARVARVYPLFILSLLVAAPSVIEAQLASEAPTRAALKIGVALAVHVAAAQAWAPWATLAWNSPSWTLSCEIFFYLTFPWLCRHLVHQDTSRRTWTALAPYWMLSIVPLAIAMLAEAGPGTTQVVRNLPLTSLFAFAIGVALGGVHDTVTHGRHARTTHTLAAAAVASLWLPPGAFIVLSDCGVMAILSAALVVRLAREPRGAVDRVLAHAWFRRLGAASYAMYILQAPVHNLLGSADRPDDAASFGLFFTVLVAVSVVLDGTIEPRVRARVKSWLFSLLDARRSRQAERAEIGDAP